ncbi:MAG TPA: hypothetical protein VNA29_04820 [Sphingomicrobium sp.]|nr:hypothetical protein [Sphingomicrobium sp.]
MENRENQTPPTGQQSDISKSQSQQQPFGQGQQQPAGQAGEKSETGTQDKQSDKAGQFENSQQGQSDKSGQFESSQPGQQDLGTSESLSSPDEGLQGDTLAQQRTDIEGASLTEKKDEQGFVGSESESDSSSGLIEGQDFDKDGQGSSSEDR